MQIFHSCHQKLTKIDWLIVAVLLLVSLFFTVAVPPAEKSDESVHYHKAVDVASGNLFCSPNTKPVRSSFYHFADEIKNFGHIHQERFFPSILPILASQTNAATEVTACLTLPLPGYILSALPIRLALSFNDAYAPIIGFYGARLINWLFFAIILLLTLKISPTKYRPYLYLTAGLPMFLYQVGVIGYDSNLNSLYLLIFANFCWLQEKFRLRTIKKQDFFFFAGLLLLAQLVKPGYYLLMGLIFALPFWRLFRQKSQYIVSLIIIFALFGLGTWSQLRANMSYELFYPSYTQQIAFVKDHPWFFAQVVGRTLLESTDTYFAQLIGQFGWLEYGLSFGARVAFIIITILVLTRQFLRYRREHWLENWQLIVLSLLLIGSFFLIIIPFYFNYTAPADQLILGVQGRYFIPLVPFTLLIVTEIAKKIKPSTMAKTVAMILSLLIVFDCGFSVYQRYYDYRTSVSNPHDLAAQLDQVDNKNVIIPTNANRFLLKIADLNKKVNGFDFYYLRTGQQPPIYQYQVKDANCQQVLISGFLAPAIKGQFFDASGSARLQLERPITPQGNICLEWQPSYAVNVTDKISVGNYHGQALIVPTYVN